MGFERTEHSHPLHNDGAPGSPQTLRSAQPGLRGAVLADFTSRWDSSRLAAVILRPTPQRTPQHPILQNTFPFHLNLNSPGSQPWMVNFLPQLVFQAITKKTNPCLLSIPCHIPREWDLMPAAPRDLCAGQPSQEASCLTGHKHIIMLSVTAPRALPHPPCAPHESAADDSLHMSRCLFSWAGMPVW